MLVAAALAIGVGTTQADVGALRADASISDQTAHALERLGQWTQDAATRTLITTLEALQIAEAASGGRAIGVDIEPTCTQPVFDVLIERSGRLETVLVSAITGDVAAREPMPPGVVDAPPANARGHLIDIVARHQNDAFPVHSARFVRVAGTWRLELSSYDDSGGTTTKQLDPITGDAL